MSHPNTRSICAALTVALLAGLVVSATPSHAQDIRCGQDERFPCAFQAEAVSLQKVPAVFKFQSRISQAKLPLGEAVFETVFVKLLRGADVMCLEQFNNVTVQNSVINLTIGETMNCELDEIIAENSSLSFQICLGSDSNCLIPLELGASPYAIKSSFASQAQNATQANTAAQAHYAHRVTADRDLLLRDTLGTGYFDFYTHPAADALALYDAVDYLQYANSGFIQWTPVSTEDALAVHIVAKDPNTDQLRPLDRFVVVANEHILRGDLTVTERGIHVTGDSDIDGNTTLIGQFLAGYDPANLMGTLDGTTHGIDGPLQVTGATQIDSGGVHVVGDSDVQGRLGVNTVTPGYTVDVNGDINFTGQLRRNGELLSIDGAQWSGGVGGGLYYTAGNVGVGTEAPGYTLDVDGDINFTGQLVRDGLAVPFSPWIDEGDSLRYEGGVAAQRFTSGPGSVFQDLILGATGTGFARGTANLRGLGDRTGLRVFTNDGSEAAIFGDNGDLTLAGNAFTASLDASTITTNSLQSNGGINANGTVSAGFVTANSINSIGGINASGSITASGNMSASGSGSFSQVSISGRSIVYQSASVGGTADTGFTFGGSSFFMVDDDGDIQVGDYVYADEYRNHSDARIKTVRGVSDGASDLATLLGLEITDYVYRDQRKGKGVPQKKLIAQQVEAVYPDAVSSQPGVVPDVFVDSVAVHLDGDRLEVTVPSDHGLAVGDTVRLELALDQGASFDVVATPSPRRFVVEGWDRGPVASVFVYGRNVDDYRSVDYDAIAMLNVSATQELARRVDDLDSLRDALDTQRAKLDTQRAELDALREENRKLRAQFGDLAAMREEMKAVLAACQNPAPAHAQDAASDR